MKYLYQVRLGDDNEDLKYSLRSLDKFAPDGEVVIGGYLPSWIDPDTVTHIHVPQAPDGAYKERNATNILYALLRETDRSDNEWVMMNDDFFFLKQAKTIPVYHNGPLSRAALESRAAADERVLSEYVPPERIPGIGTSVTVVQSFADSLDKVAELLKKDGIADPVSYELHMPLPVRPELLDIAIKWCDNRYPPYRAGAGTFHRHNVRWRSVYGNLFSIGGEERKDVKIYDKDTPIPTGADFVSTVDTAWVSNSRVARSLKRRFSSPSKFEKG